VVYWIPVLIIVLVVWSFWSSWKQNLRGSVAWTVHGNSVFLFLYGMK
jgi:hypothetical protein